MSQKAQQQLVRLLTLLPYLREHPGVPTAQIAADFGIDDAQVLKDLNLLWMCGLPGGFGGDLIDLAISEESVSVIDSVGMDRALRLTAGEAMALALALQMLADQPSTVDPQAARSAIAKIEQATGTAIGLAADPAGADTGAEADADRRRAAAAAPVVRAALQDGQALVLHYHSASRDTVSERIVDPVRVRLIDGHSYLEAWCRRAEGMRLFRFDRIDRAEPIGPATPPPAAADAPAVDLFAAEQAAPDVPVRIAADAAWVTEYFPLTGIRHHADGTVTARLTYGSPEWLVRQLIGFGGALTVLAEPTGETTQTIAESAARRAAEALKIYERTGS